MQLYDYFRSGAAYRTRIGLNIKGLEYEQISVHLTKDGGEQYKADYAAVNPQMLVPTLIDGDLKLTQSLAIMEYLDEVYPEPRLLPSDVAGRARVRALAQIIACEVHPINNLKVRLYLVDEMGVSPDDRKIWIAHWISEGLTAYDKLLDDDATGDFSHGDKPTMADSCLIPQLYNARLNGCDLSAYKNILRVEENCQAHPAFIKAHPDQQPDAE
ncbi:MAG: maleylacetoacetate isomerase [Proteobacteria bacterium]|nr:maleylacetoacetate isomerase [Pseudomonadota bacterium]